MNKTIYKNLRGKDLKSEGIYIGEGRFVVERMLFSGWQMHSVLCSERMEEHFSDLCLDRCPLIVVSEEEMESVAGFRFHRGVMAAGVRPRFIAVEDYIQKTTHLKRIIICPDISSAENLGSIIRSCAALGADAVVIGKQCSDPLSRRCIKVSMGAVFKMPLVVMEDKGEGVESIRKAGFEIYGTFLSDTALNVKEFEPAQRFALVFGNEACGLDSFWAGVCTEHLMIPMRQGTDSLNVGVAAGIFMHSLFE